MEGLEHDKATQEERVDKLVENRRALNRVKEELERIANELPPKQELVDKNKRILELQQEIKRDKTQFESFRKAKGFKSRLENLDKELEPFSCFVGAEREIERLNAAQNELQSLERQRTGLQEDINTLRGQRPAPRMLFLGLVLLAAGLIGSIATKYFGVAVVLGLSLSGYWLVSQMAWSRQIRSMSCKAVELESQSQDYQQIAECIVKSFGFQDHDEYQGQFVKYEEKISERKETRDKLTGIIGDKDWDKFEEEKSDLDIQVSASQKELQQLLPFTMDPLHLQKLLSEVHKQQAQKNHLEREKVGLERFFGYTDVDTDQLANIEEELCWLEEEREFWERKARVFDIIREALGEAHKETLSKAAEVLENELGRYISIISKGRYGQVRVDESDLSIWTLSPEKADWVNVRELSRATQDQFYICARFALVKLITEGRRPPLLLDDPFVNFHPTRLKRTIPLLRELAKENQILLFTCSNAYDGFGNVVLLD